MTDIDSRARFWRFALVSLALFWLITAIVVIRVVSAQPSAQRWDSGLVAERQHVSQWDDAASPEAPARS